MIENVSFEKTTYAAPPARFEAGTPAISRSYGYGCRHRLPLELGLDKIAAHEDELIKSLRKTERGRRLTFYRRS